MAAQRTTRSAVEAAGLRWRFQRRRVRRLGARIRRTIATFLGRARARVSRRLLVVRGLPRRVTPFAIIGVLAFGAGSAAVIVYGLYGFHPDVATARWAALTPHYDSVVACRPCHATVSASLASSGHARIACESCHGPLSAHAAGGVEVVVRPAASIPPASACAACHQAVVGRPATFAVVDLSKHFGGPACLACHDPHTTLAPAPPGIPHPLERLPACLTCHGQQGMNPLPATHPVWPGTCFTCHSLRQT